MNQPINKERWLNPSCPLHSEEDESRGRHLVSHCTCDTGHPDYPYKTSSQPAIPVGEKKVYMSGLIEYKVGGSLDWKEPSTPHVQEGWEKEFDKLFFQDKTGELIGGWLAMDTTEVHNNNGLEGKWAKIAIPTDVKSFISTLLLKERKEAFIAGQTDIMFRFEESDLVKKAKKEEREKIMREVDGMMKEAHKTDDGVHKYGCVGCLEVDTYNLALTDLKERLNKRIN